VLEGPLPEGRRRRVDPRTAPLSATGMYLHAQLEKRHEYQLSYTVTRLALQAAGLVTKGKRRRRITRSGSVGRYPV